MKLEVIGAGDLSRKLKTLANTNQVAAEGAVRKICYDLKGKAMRLAPVKFGDLRRSAYVATNKLEGEVGFLEPYATIQHEAEYFNHPKGGEAKYLEKPFNESVGQYIEMVKNMVIKELIK